MDGWEQRFYTDMHLAPSWGYQVDETAGVIYGIWKKYKRDKEIKFLKDNLKMCEKASEFLQKYLVGAGILGDPNGSEMQPSYDIWEENEGIHTYSLASIYGAFTALSKIYGEAEELFKNNRLKQNKLKDERKKLEEYQYKIKEYILKNLYNDKKKIFVRNNSDKKVDISLLRTSNTI